MSLKICCFLKVMMLSLFSVDDLPTTHDSNFFGAQALPSITGNGAYVQHKEYFYELVCSSTACTWTIMEKQLTTDVYDAVMMFLSKKSWRTPIKGALPVMMYLPQDYTC